MQTCARTSVHLTHAHTHTLVRYLTLHCLALFLLHPDINPSWSYMLPFLQRLRRKTIQDKRRKQSTVKKRAQAMARNEEKLRVATQSFVAANEMVRKPYCLHKIAMHGSGTLRIVVVHIVYFGGRVSRSPTFSTLFSLSLTHFSHPTPSRCVLALVVMPLLLEYNRYQRTLSRSWATRVCSSYRASNW